MLDETEYYNIMKMRRFGEDRLVVPLKEERVLHNSKVNGSIRPEGLLLRFDLIIYDWIVVAMCHLVTESGTMYMAQDSSRWSHRKYDDFVDVYTHCRQVSINRIRSYLMIDGTIGDDQLGE